MCLETPEDVMSRTAWMCVVLTAAVACADDGDTQSKGDNGAGTTDATDEVEGTTGVEDTGSDEPAFDAAAELERLLIGFYDSADQAASSRDYFNIMLTMCPVSVPELGERVLYVEQTSADTPNDPYRQRLYLLEAGATETQAISRIYELAGPGSFVGACDDAENAEFNMERVLLLEGCDVTLDWNGEQFVGSTDGDSCGTDFGGATYATSEITLNESLLVSWDRGYDARGRQVWGATAGGYEFVRQTELGSW